MVDYIGSPRVIRCACTGCGTEVPVRVIAVKADHCGNPGGLHPTYYQPGDYGGFRPADKPHTSIIQPNHWQGVNDYDCAISAITFDPDRDVVFCVKCAGKDYVPEGMEVAFMVMAMELRERPFADAGYFLWRRLTN